jgi:uridylate kinase
MPTKLTIVIKLTGAAVEKTVGTVNLDYLKRFGVFINHLAKSCSIAVTIGGGHVARQYIVAAKELGAPDSKASVLGGDVGFLNAQLVLAALTSSGVRTHCTPVESFDAAEEQLRAGVIPVLFGRWPALTSDSVAVYFADYVSANLVLKFSQIDSIYDRDPKIHSDAVPCLRLSHDELETLAIQYDNRIAGEQFVIDLLASKRLKNSNIPLWLLHMNELDLAAETLSKFPSIDTTRGTLVGDILM